MWPTEPQIVGYYERGGTFCLFVYFKCLLFMKETGRALGHVKGTQDGQVCVCVGQDDGEEEGAEQNKTKVGQGQGQHEIKTPEK